MKKFIPLVFICLLKFSFANSTLVQEAEITLDGGITLTVRPIGTRMSGSGSMPRSEKGSSFQSNSSFLEIAGQRVNRQLPMPAQIELFKQWPFVKNIVVKMVPAKVTEIAHEKIGAYIQKKIQMVDETIIALRKILEEFKPYGNDLKNYSQDISLELSANLTRKANFFSWNPDQYFNFLREGIACLENSMQEELLNLTKNKDNPYLEQLAVLKNDLAVELLQSYKDYFGKLPSLNPEDPKVQEIKSLLEWSSNVGNPSAQKNLQLVLSKINASQKK